MILLGLKIVPHPLARDVRVEFKVTRWATRDKKRKNWRVMRIEINRPGCYQVGDRLYMHPDLIAKLPSERALNRMADDARVLGLNYECPATRAKKCDDGR
jgi:hypothetical protein